MRPLCCLAPLLTVALSLGSASPANAQASTSVGVAAEFGSRSSLRVSSQLLEFQIADPTLPATAVVDFAAGVRTAAGAPVVLSVEPLRAVDGPGGAADVEVALSFATQAEGAQAGPVNGTRPVPVARWTGGGFRQGRVLFQLRAAAPGSYVVPVRFVLSTP